MWGGAIICLIIIGITVIIIIGTMQDDWNSKEGTNEDRDFHHPGNRLPDKDY